MVYSSEYITIFCASVHKYCPDLIALITPGGDVVLICPLDRRGRPQTSNLTVVTIWKFWLQALVTRGGVLLLLTEVLSVEGGLPSIVVGARDLLVGAEGNVLVVKEPGIAAIAAVGDHATILRTL